MKGLFSEADGEDTNTNIFDRDSWFKTEVSEAIHVNWNIGVQKLIDVDGKNDDRHFKALEHICYTGGFEAEAEAC